MTTRVQATLLLGAVLLAGVVLGVALDRTVLAPPGRAFLMQRPGTPSVDRMVRRMQRGLDLSEQQTAQVREILERRQPRVREIWSDARTGLLAQVDTAMQELGGVLTPAQQERLERALRARGIGAGRGGR